VTGRRAIALLALAVLGLPTAALARVAVSGPAKTPLVRGALGATVPRQCAAVYRSTVNRSWAERKLHRSPSAARGEK
jgi:hypothetical protein